jgi:hypothetical protein
VYVGVSKTSRVETMSFDETKHLLILRDGYLWKFTCRAEDRFPVLQVSHGEFAQDEWVSQDGTSIQQASELRIGLAQVVHPCRGIDQNPLGSERRRGVDFNPGSVPPRSAKRRALSL